MESTYRNSLSGEVQTMVDEIEAHCSREIAVRCETSPGIYAEGCEGSATWSIEPATGKVQDVVIRADVWMPRIGSHEILHLHRTLVQGVPSIAAMRWVRLSDAHGTSDGTIRGSRAAMYYTDQHLETCLEHLWIAPRMEQLGFPGEVDPAKCRPFWVNQRQFIEQTHKATYSHPYSLVVLLDWLKIRLLCPEAGELHDLARASLDKSGLLPEAVDFEDAARRALNNPDLAGGKAQLILALKRTFGFPQIGAILWKGDRPGVPLELVEARADAAYLA